MSEQRERMLAGELYVDNDPELVSERVKADRLTREFNDLPKDQSADRRRVLLELFGSVGEDVDIVAPIRADYGYNVHIGARSFSNWGVIYADVAEIRIGEDVMIGPNVQLVTPFHPLDPELRRAHWEGGKPITIADNVWLGAGVIVCPGVSIGENSVVGAGSVVTRDIPANVVVVGSPAKVIREL